LEAKNVCPGTIYTNLKNLKTGLKIEEVKGAEDKVMVLLSHLLIFLKLRYLNSNRPCCGALFYFYW
jgi:hypothetical protein